MSISLQRGNVCAGLPGYGCFSGLEFPVPGLVVTL